MIRPGYRRLLPVLPVLFALGFALWALFSSHLPLTQLRLTQLDRELRDTATAINRMVETNAESLSKLSSLLEVRNTAIAEAPEQAAVLFRERIEKAATGAGLRSRTMGVVRRSELIPSVVLLEVNFSADGKTGELVVFLESLYRDRPRLYWKTINIKPNNLAAPEFITISGTLTAVSFAETASASGGEAAPVSEASSGVSPASAPTSGLVSAAASASAPAAASASSSASGSESTSASGAKGMPPSGDGAPPSGPPPGGAPPETGGAS